MANDKTPFAANDGSSSLTLHQPVGWVSPKDDPPGPSVGGDSAEALLETTGLERNPDGSVNLQIIPRIGTMSSLLGLAGSNGEIASSTDYPALVRYTGTVGEAAPFVPDGRKDILISGTGSVAHPAMKPTAGILWLTKAGSVADITSIGRLENGYFEGQTVEVVNKTGLASAFFHGGVTLNNNQAFTCLWTNGTWQVVSDRYYAASYTATAIRGAGGDATAANAVAYGTNSLASGTNSVALASGQATGAGAVAILGGLADKQDSLSFGGKTSWKRQAVGRSSAPTSAAESRSVQRSNVILGGRTTAATAALLTVSGIAGVTELLLGGWKGKKYFEVTVIGEVPNSDEICVFKRKGIVRSDGTLVTGGVALLGTVDTVGTDVNIGIGGSPAVAITIGAAPQLDLRVSCTGVVSKEIIWCANFEFTEVVV